MSSNKHDIDRYILKSAWNTLYCRVKTTTTTTTAKQQRVRDLCWGRYADESCY